jgi:signal transduction histidine kinase
LKNLEIIRICSFIDSFPLPTYVVCPDNVLLANLHFLDSLGLESRLTELNSTSCRERKVGEYVARYLIPREEPAKTGVVTVALKVSKPNGSTQGLIAQESRNLTLMSELGDLIIGVAMPNECFGEIALGIRPPALGISWHDPIGPRPNLKKSWRSFPRWLGYPEFDPVPFAKWLVKVRPGDRRRVSSRINLALKNRRTFQLSYRMLDASGRVRLVQDVLFFDSSSGTYQGGILVELKHENTSKFKGEKQLISLVRRLLRKNDEIHRQFALTLHDDIISGMIVLKMKLESLALNGESKAQCVINEAVRELSHLSNIARNISHQTWPALLEALGLKDALWELTQKLRRDSGIECIATISPTFPLLNQDLSASIYRIVQEAFTNIVKHSKATEAQLSVTWNNLAVSVTVRDNGIGIDEKKGNGSRSLGLAGMRERARGAKGTFSICKMKGGGTEVKARFPLSGR